MSVAIQENWDFQVIDVSFPHIGKRLELLWGYPEFNLLMDELQGDTREGQRKGFPPNVLFALANLSQAHDKAFPHLAGARPSVWSESNFR